MDDDRQQELIEEAEDIAALIRLSIDAGSNTNNIMYRLIGILSRPFHEDDSTNICLMNDQVEDIVQTHSHLVSRLSADLYIIEIQLNKLLADAIDYYYKEII